MEECRLCEEAWEAAKEMTESERKRKRRQICLSLDASFCEDVMEVAEALGIDQSRVVELCLKHGADKALPLLKKFARELRELEEGGGLGESESAGEEEEEGGEE